MILRKWKALPSEMQCEEVKKYYDILKKKKGSLFFKRVFDFLLSSLLIVVLSPLFLCLALSIKIDSSGPVFFRQVRDEIRRNLSHFQIPDHGRGRRENGSASDR